MQLTALGGKDGAFNDSIPAVAAFGGGLAWPPRCTMAVMRSRLSILRRPHHGWAIAADTLFGRSAEHRRWHLCFRPLRRALGRRLRLVALGRERVPVIRGHRLADLAPAGPAHGQARGEAALHSIASGDGYQLPASSAHGRAVALVRAELPPVRILARGQPAAHRQTGGHMVPQKPRQGAGHNDNGEQLRRSHCTDNHVAGYRERLVGGGVRRLCGYRRLDRAAWAVFGARGRRRRRTAL